LVGGLCPKCLASFFLAAPSEETPHEPSPNEPTPRPTSLRVVLVGGGQRFERVLLPGAPCLLGRAQACGICLEDQSISMEHARLCLASGRLLIEDLGSANGTWVDDRPITTPTPLLPGATLKLGACTLTIERVAAAAAQPAQPTPPSAHGLADGSVKGRNLELAQVIGEGGMGLIFEAKDHNVGRQVAVKKLKPAQRADPDQVARFIREAQIAGQLEHPGIVPVYELGVDAEGQPFYAMRRLRGVTLADVLADLSANAPQAIAAYPLGTLLAIFQKVCEAVAYAHSRQVIHRDLKPENIMLGQFGEVIVMDWGLAKTATTGEAGKPATPRGQSGSPPGGEMPPQPAGGTPALPGAPTQTLDDVVMGSPGYMAPEQAQGKTRQCDERTDVYALGAILYTILTLRPPVRGKDIHLLLDRTRSGDIRTPTDFNPGTWWSGSPGPAHPLPHCPGRRIPAPLSAIAMKALALAPEHRYQTVAELQRDLLAFQNGFLTTAEQAGFRRQLSVLVRRHRRGAAVLAAGIVLLGVVLAARYAATVWSRHGLRVTAPIYIDLASNLVREQKFDAALEKVDFALRLQPEEARFHTFKGNILEGQLMLREAASAYEQALRCNPADAAALTNRDLCTRILREAPAATNIPATLLHELRMACIRQGRGAEALAISARIRVDERRFFEMWQAYVKDHGIPASLYLEKGELCS
jgi:serine/threonine protein kinase